MVLPKSNLSVLNRRQPIELVLELDSFAGGENTIGSDAEVKKNEARICKNWDSDSLGGMIRSKGFNEIADGGGTYTDLLDLLIQHEEGTNQEVYGVIEGDLVIKNGTSIDQEDVAPFTSGKLCHAVSAGDALWIANDTDSLQIKTIGNAIAAATDQPANVGPRIYTHKFRLVSEGSGKTVYGSRAATGNWNAADGWSLANDAYNIDLPDDTFGAVMDFPSGNEYTVFTKSKAYGISNAPNVAYRPIPNSHGCSAPYSIAKGNEGVFFVSDIPTLGVYLWNGVQWINITEFHDFVNDINFSARIFGKYRDRKYHLFYNKSGSGVSYVNTWRTYDTRWGRWSERPINSDVADNFGYPALLNFTNNEFYVGSSRKDKIYELETTDNSDEGENTEANYKTKDFSSKDFSMASGGGFPIDDVTFKLTSMTVTFFGTIGTFSVQWTMDRGRVSGSQTITVTADGAKINEDFVVNTSKVIILPPDKTITRSFKNNAVGKTVNIQIINNATGERTKIKKLKIEAVTVV